MKVYSQFYDVKLGGDLSLKEHLENNNWGFANHL